MDIVIIVLVVCFFACLLTWDIRRGDRETVRLLSELKFRVGDIVYHRASRARGIILKRYEYKAYLVKFSFVGSKTNTSILASDGYIKESHFEEYCEEFELEAEQ